MKLNTRGDKSNLLSPIIRGVSYDLHHPGRTSDRASHSSDQIVGGTKTVVTVTHFDSGENAPPRLPDRTQKEIRARIESMLSNWVPYEGMTPSLKLKVRYQDYENLRRFARKYIDLIGQDNFESLSPQQMEKLMMRYTSDANVCDWEGAQYPNGNPLPYTPANLFLFIERDPLLFNFIVVQADKLGPP